MEPPEWPRVFGTQLSNYPLYSVPLLQTLRVAGVVTAEDLMAAEVADIVSRSNGALSAEEVQGARAEACEFFGGLQSSVLAESLTERGGRAIETGQPDFDALLGGGLPSGKAVELVGPMGIGKTQLCMWLAARLVAQDPLATVVFVSSSNAVHAQRLIDLLDFVPADLRAERVSRIRLHQCLDAEQLMQTMYDLHDSLAASVMGREAATTRIAAIIVDSVAPLLLPTLGKAPFGHSLLFAFRTVLFECAAVWQSAMILTNFVAGQSDRSDEGLTWAMGPSWGQVPSVRLWLSPAEDSASDAAILTVSCAAAGYFQRACTMHVGRTGLRFAPHHAHNNG
jgi:hypothetical protein